MAFGIFSSNKEEKRAIVDAPFSAAGFTVSRAFLPEGVYRALKKEAENPFDKLDTYRNGNFTVDSRGGVNYKKLPSFIAQKEESLASIRLIKYDDKGKTFKNLIPKYTRFFLTSVQEAHQEKYQIVETFNDWYVFFYGERPLVYTYSGEFLNTRDYQWKNDFKFYYNRYLRGTAAVDRQAQTVLVYDDTLVMGYILGFQLGQQAINDMRIPFSMTVLVSKWEPLKFSEDFIYQTRDEKGNFVSTNSGVVSPMDIPTDKYINELQPLLIQNQNDTVRQKAMQILNNGNLAQATKNTSLR